MITDKLTIKEHRLLLTAFLETEGEGILADYEKRIVREAREDERKRIYAARIIPPWEGKAVVESLTHGEIVQIPKKELVED